MQRTWNEHVNGIYNLREENEAGKRIPFDVSIDSFYSEANIGHLKNIISEIDSGKAHLTEHELLED